jgi:hypothetical protein
MYSAVERNQILPPNYSEACVSAHYLAGVIQNQYFYIKTEDVKFRNCFAKNVTKQEIFAQVKLATRDKRLKPWGFDESCLPNTSWLLHVLATYNPEHAWFSKGYVAPKKKVEKGVYVDNASGFFSGLAKPERKRKHKKQSIMRLTERLPMPAHEARARVENIVKAKAALDAKLQGVQDEYEERAGQHPGASNGGASNVKRSLDPPGLVAGLQPYD